LKKTTKKLSLDRATIRSLDPNALRDVNGGISGPKGCNNSIEQCGPTVETCPISGSPMCVTGSSCNSLACP
jgi:hypothetical protein